MKNVVVFGAGVAGLSVAYELAKNNINVDIIEKDSQVGGLAKSFTKNGFTFDLGPHFFLSKDEYISNTIHDLLEDNNLIDNTIKSRIYINGKYFKWPLKIFNAIFTLSPLVTMRIFLEYLAIKTRKNKIDDSFESYVINRFGKSLYDIFFKDYNKKLLGLPPSSISVDWAQQRIGLTGVTEVIKKALFDSQDKEKANIGKFCFPEYGGIGSISLKFREAIEAKGSKVHLNSYPIKIEEKKVTFMNKDQRVTKKYDAIVSTIPLTGTIKLFDDIPQDVKESSSSLKFRSNIFVYLVLNKERIGDDHWIYFPHPEEEIFFNRLTEFKNFSEKVCPVGKTIVCAEITCNFDDKIWNSDEEILIAKVKSKLISLDFIKENDILDSFIKKERHSYVVYDMDYKKNKNKVLNFLDKKGIYSIGRHALFYYNDMTYSIDMGFKLAKYLINQDKGYEILLQKMNSSRRTVCI